MTFLMPGSVQIPQATFERDPFTQKCQYLTRTHLENVCVMERYKYSMIAQMNSYTGIECIVVIILSRCKNSSSLIPVAGQDCLHPFCVLDLTPVLIPELLWLTSKSVP